MQLFKSKKSFKENVDLDTNRETTWSRMISEWHLFLRLSLVFARKILNFVGKNPNFYPRDVCSISVFLI